jgi:hypothetical protein
MAIIRTPLLSFGARGKIGSTLVFFSWKGIDVVREYIIPTNPQTAAQTAQRGWFADSIRAFRTYYTNLLERAAWNRLATVDSRIMSGFNEFVSNASQLLAMDPDASFANGAVAAAGNAAVVTMLNADDGAVGDEAGDFEVWVGDLASSLLLFESVAIAGGSITTSDLGDVDDVKYVKLRKGGYDRSGIHKITLIA